MAQERRQTKPSSEGRAPRGEDRAIVVRGAREHNLKGIDVDIPRGKLVVLTGVSGSGKSSLALDVLHREGRRRYLESLSGYARKKLGQVERPDVDHIEGLTPSIAMDQGVSRKSPRSTVATLSGIHEHLRLLYANIGVAHCIHCSRPLRSQTIDELAERVLRDHEDERCLVLAPVLRDRKGEHRAELEAFALKGFVRARIDGEIVRLDEPVSLDGGKRHTIEIVVDRLKVQRSKRSRLVEALETAARFANRRIAFVHEDDHFESTSLDRVCPDCEWTFPDLEPRLFSFNTSRGQCSSCSGRGVLRRFEASRIPRGRVRRAFQELYPKSSKAKGKELFTQVAAALGLDKDTTFEELDPQTVRLLMEEGHGAFPGFVRAFEEMRSFLPEGIAEAYEVTVPCEDCGGTRLGPEARAVTVADVDIAEFVSRSVESALAHIEEVALKLGEFEKEAVSEVLDAIAVRLRFLLRAGASYLCLDRSVSSLSGGETQRVRLAAQLGEGLEGVLYVLDEPSVGLHPTDLRKLIEILGELRDRGNTLVVVDHDPEMMRAADVLIELGPGAGSKGGDLVAQGGVDEVRAHPSSATASALRGELRESEAPTCEIGSLPFLLVRGANRHNLRDLTVKFPLHCLVSVTGVSGSGKSTLIHDVLKRALLDEEATVEGDESLSKVIEVDQSPLGRTQQSNPATYTGMFDAVRELFAKTQEARARGYTARRFSFNVAGGRCEACQGAGKRLVSMQLIADIEVPCEECAGARYEPETLDIRYKGLSIEDVLSLTVDEAWEPFEAIPALNRPLSALRDVGLGYVTLGQSATTLSGGEAQRVKLARELAKPREESTLYLLDEPTTGLHPQDVHVLLGTLRRLVEAGHSVIVIEHDLDVIAASDHVIDLGPGGGDEGGAIVFEGTPRALASCEDSKTGLALRDDGEHETRPVLRSEASKLERTLKVRGARTHNLRDLDLDLPGDRMTVITGVSGSGKSSLAYETLFSEGQRRFVESLSTYARQFLSILDKAPVESIDGLRPAIGLDTKIGLRGRQTVASSADIEEVLRTLFAKVGIPHCPVCGDEAPSFSPSRAARQILEEHEGERLRVMAPLYHRESGLALALSSPADLEAQQQSLVADGYLRVMVDGEERRLDENGATTVTDETAQIDLVLDRLVGKESNARRLSDSIEQAFQVGRGVAAVRVGERRVDLSTRQGCVRHGFFHEARVSPSRFSFSSRLGQCPECKGQGTLNATRREPLIKDDSLPLSRGGLNDDVAKSLQPSDWEALAARAEEASLDLEAPWSQWPESMQRRVMEGPNGLRALAEASGDAEESFSIGSEKPIRCPSCEGERLAPAYRAVTVGGRSFAQTLRLSVGEAVAFFESLSLQGSRARIGRGLLNRILERLRGLRDMGLPYLSLDRPLDTLSLGEAQRVRLASRLGCDLAGVLYVLDEPTIGLHPQDVERLLERLRMLRDRGNTVVVVEHDPTLIQAADHIVDLGPGAGEHGGNVVVQGSLEDLLACQASSTSTHLRAERASPNRRLALSPRSLCVRGASRNNLRDIDVDVPLEALTVITGVSGAGKSSLMQALGDAVLARHKGRSLDGLDVRTLTSASEVQGVVTIDQRPLASNAASLCATSLGVYPAIRALLAKAEEAKMRGFDASRFSLHRDGGRCEACQGRGVVQVALQILADVEVLCDVCEGRRFDRATLAVQYRGKNVAEILAMSIEEACAFFRRHKALHATLSSMIDMGLGYLRLGQATKTLATGEAQRMRLALELSKRQRRASTLFLLDEPSIGLHPEDVMRLLGVLHALVENGHTVVVVDHDPWVIWNADQVIDLGPGAGHEGGSVLSIGSPQDIAATRSPTGRFLNEWRQGYASPEESETT